jgi:hypothetical protein
VVVRKTSISSKKPAGRPGRKATGLRDLPPEAARLAVNHASLRAVTDAVDLQKQIGRETGHAAPTLLRLMRQDVQISTMRVPTGSGELVSQAVVRAASAPLARRMQTDRFAANLVRVGMCFEEDVERARIGNMTSSYGEGGGGGGGVKDYAFVQAARMERLLRASEKLNDKERPAVWGYVVFGLPLRDIGWLTAGERLGSRSGSMCDVGALFVEAALERMEPHYMAIGDRD